MKTKLEQLVHELTLSCKTIKKWHRRVLRVDAISFNSHCAFCLDNYSCKPCPIVKYGFGLDGCRNTPYYAWHRRCASDSPEEQQAAIKELLFLIKVANHVCGLIEKEIGE